MTARSIRLLLAASLALNIFAVGALAGGLWMWSRIDAPAQRVGGLRVAGDDLPREQRRAFRRALRQTTRQSSDVVAAARAARLEAAAAFSAPAFDPAAANAALARARAVDLTLRKRREERVVAFAARLPAEQRAALAEGLKRGPFRQRRGEATDRRGPHVKDEAADIELDGR